MKLCQVHNVKWSFPKIVFLPICIFIITNITMEPCASIIDARGAPTVSYLCRGPDWDAVFDEYGVRMCWYIMVQIPFPPCWLPWTLLIQTSHTPSYYLRPGHILRIDNPLDHNADEAGSRQSTVCTFHMTRLVCVKSSYCALNNEWLYLF